MLPVKASTPDGNVGALPHSRHAVHGSHVAVNESDDDYDENDQDRHAYQPLDHGTPLAGCETRICRPGTEVTAAAIDSRRRVPGDSGAIRTAWVRQNRPRGLVTPLRLLSEELDTKPQSPGAVGDTADPLLTLAVQGER